MNKNSLHNNIRLLMRIHGNLSVSALARAAKVPQPTLHHILFGATKNPRKEALETLARFFGVSVKQLLGEEPLPKIIPETIKHDLKIKTIPLIDWEMLKNWPNSDGQYFDEILLDRQVSKHSFALCMQDARMDLLFPKDAILIFDFEKQPADRDFVLIHQHETDEILFNRFFTDKKERYIKQSLTDGDIKLIKLKPDVDKILGTLIEVRVRY